MPIDIEQFEAPASLGELTTSERIVRFLVEHADQAYTRAELADALEVNPETVGPNLTRLKARGLVRHRAPYWAFTDDHERARTVLRERGADDLIALLAAPDRDGRPDVDPRLKKRRSRWVLMDREESRRGRHLEGGRRGPTLLQWCEAKAHGESRGRISP